MNFVFISPQFPTNYYHFCAELKNNGVNVLGIGDSAYDSLPYSLKNVLTESLEHINQLNARVDKVEKTLGDTVDLLNEVADMLSSK